MSATTLPKISPISTPVPKLQRTLSAASYGPYPPRELSSSMELVRIPQRVNPLAPPPPKKRINMAWETVDQHWHNEARRVMMQQREHQRYHSAWSKPFYGQPAEKEQYRYVQYYSTMNKTQAFPIYVNIVFPKILLIHICAIL